MNPRYRITKSTTEAEDQQVVLSLEECQVFFSTQPDFLYTREYVVRSGDTTMTIEGEFFMWQVGGKQVPFRYFEGDLYVAVSHELIYHKMVEVAQALDAQYVEG